MTNSLLVSANDVKLALMMLHRFAYQAVMCVTEAGKFSADVLVISKKQEIVEFEIKISVTDLKADFRKHEKHLKYSQSVNESDTEKLHSVPHYFYFVIPEMLLTEAYPILAKYPNYGVMVFKNEPFNTSVKWLDTTGFLKTVRRPKLLRTMKITNEEFFSLQKRLSSELIREKIKNKLRG